MRLQIAASIESVGGEVAGVAGRRGTCYPRRRLSRARRRRAVMNLVTIRDGWKVRRSQVETSHSRAKEHVLRVSDLLRAVKDVL